jgi:ferredoxin/flavodoxin---NADP+ reductase
MSNLIEERVTEVHHWNDTLFSFKTTRSQGLRFHNGHFVMIGLEVEGKPLLRAYSIASANYEEHLEFFSIKVPDGKLKPTGTLVLDDLKPGKHLFLFGTGTGLAPFMSIIKDPDAYEKFEKIILVHGVRYVSELAYCDFITRELPENEFFGDEVKQKLVYYPTVTREEFKTVGRVTTLIETGQMCEDVGLPPLNPETDRAMICGSPSMLADIRALLDERGFQVSPGVGEPGDYVFERAFVEK